MIENDNIKELFSKSLENHTASVRPEVWNGLQAKMAAAGVSSVAATKGLSVLTKWIIGSAAVTGTAVITTIAVMNSGSDKPAEKAPEQTAGSKTEIAQQPSVDEAQLPVIVERPSESTESALAAITTEDPFLVILPEGRPGATGEAGPATDPVKSHQNLSGDPFVDDRKVNPNPVEPGKVIEIPMEEEPETASSSGAESNPGFRTPVLHIPNVFTPNGDGENDTYFVQFENVPTATITFMDQNNKTVYSTTDKGFVWDGTFEGAGDPVPGGTYACVIIYQDQNGKMHKKITLIDIIRR